MKMKRYLAILFLLILALSLYIFAACSSGTSDNPPDGGDGDGDGGSVTEQTYGLPVAGAGHYIKDSDLIEDGEVRYLLYTTNETSGEEDNVIAVRKGTYTEGKGWAYGAETVAVRGTEGGWDEYIGSASLVKGSFSYQSQEYSWMMAYCATSRSNDTQFQIGLALAKAPDGAWVKVGTQPLIEFDDAVYGATSVGCYAPSLVSLDKESVVRIFYTYADAYGHFAKFIDVDAADAGLLHGATDADIVSGEVMVPNNGQIDGGDSVNMFPNADFAYDAANGLFFAIKDYSPTPTQKPAVSRRLQLLSIAEEEMYTTDIGDGWVGIRTFYNTDTPDAAFDRLYGGCVVADAYGHVDGADAIEIVYNVSDLEANTDDYLFTQNLQSFYVELAALQD